jgi:formamidopyrimidine-DNA glycosylase (fpg)
MPELPEVETIARTLAPQVVGRRLEAVHVFLPKTFAAGGDLVRHIAPGGCVASVRRRGKLLLFAVAAPGMAEAEYLLAFHLKMTGRLFVHPAQTEPGKHTRMAFDFAATPAAQAVRLFFDDARTFGYCRLMQPEDLAQWPFWANLGPEPLTLAPAAFVASLRGRNGAIKALLLDQKVVAGIGNIYADEACFRSGIRPDARAASLAPSRLEALLDAVQAVLHESIAECGSSIRDYRDANGDAGAFQNLFRVYGRAGQPCLVCGKMLERTTVAGRTTVFCSFCQRT